MLKAEDIEMITAQEFIDDIARSLDPLAFENHDVADMQKRRDDVYRCIRLAYQEYRRRDSGFNYDSPFIQDADIPW